MLDYQALADARSGHEALECLMWSLKEELLLLQRLPSSIHLLFPQ